MPTRRKFIAGFGVLTVCSVAGCSGNSEDTATPSETTGKTDTPTEEQTDTDTEPTSETHTVKMDDEWVYAPDSLTVAPGDTVVWENVGDTEHSVTADEDAIPEDADYWASGGFDSQQAAEEAYLTTGSIEETGKVPVGGSWSHTFETEGTHEYYCIPHHATGMVGEIEVNAG